MRCGCTFLSPIPSLVMNKNDIFSITKPCGLKVYGIIIDARWDDAHCQNVYLCYAKNKLFVGTTFYEWDINKVRTESPIEINETLVNNCIIPQYDVIISKYGDK